MKLLVCHPGATISVSDVHDGLVEALERRGDTEIVLHALHGRLYICELALKLAWEKKGKAIGLPKPSDVDAIYWASQGIIEKALRHQPDWVVLVTGHFFIPEFVVLLKRAGFRVAYLLTESPYEDEVDKERIAQANFAWTNERTSVSFLAQHCPTRYLPHAYNPERQLVAPIKSVDESGHPVLVHRETVQGSTKDYVIPDDLAAHDVVFVGTMFEERIKLLDAVDWSGIDLGLYGQFELLGSRSRLRKYVRGRITPNWIGAELYRRAKIGLNLFRSSIGYGRNVAHIVYAESMGPRSLELAASGLFHISEYRKEVEEVFGPSVPTFKTPEELESLVRHFKDTPDLRKQHAESARLRAIDRSFDAMAAQVVADLRAAA